MEPMNEGDHISEVRVHRCWRLVQMAEGSLKAFDLPSDPLYIFWIGGILEIRLKGRDSQPELVLLGVAPSQFLVYGRNAGADDCHPLNDSDGLGKSSGFHVDAFQIIKHPEEDIVLRQRFEKLVGPFQASA